MTVREYFEKSLISRGMLESRVREAMDSAIHDLSELGAIWDKEVQNYPAHILLFLGLILDKNVLERIDKNTPRAWYRELFTPEKK